MILQPKKEVNPYRSNVYGKFQTKHREKKIKEHLKNMEEGQVKKETVKKMLMDEKIKSSNQDVTIRQMKEFLSSYYFESNSNGKDFTSIINRIENLTKKLISHQINGNKQQWESKFHQFKMEITLEAYKRYSNSIENKRIEKMEEVYEQLEPKNKAINDEKERD
jgi:hypothetical protein